MRFKAKKQYGSYKESFCPFCHKIATQKNTQGLEVCYNHAKSAMEEIRCSCGSWLETCSGKFGPYFRCINCGNIPYKKGMELKEMTTILKEDETETKRKELKIFNPEKTEEVKNSAKREKTETTISTDDIEYFS